MFFLFTNCAILVFIFLKIFLILTIFNIFLLTYSQIKTEEINNIKYKTAVVDYLFEYLARWPIDKDPFRHLDIFNQELSF